MPPKFSHDFECPECAQILRALLNEFHVDGRDVRARFRDTAEASGRSLAEMRRAWVDSVGRMPPDEQMTVMKAHYPRLVEARRQKAEHEAQTGHFGPCPWLRRGFRPEAVRRTLARQTGAVLWHNWV